MLSVCLSSSGNAVKTSDGHLTGRMKGTALHNALPAASLVMIAACWEMTRPDRLLHAAPMLAALHYPRVSDMAAASRTISLVSRSRFLPDVVFVLDPVLVASVMCTGALPRGAHLTKTALSNYLVEHSTTDLRVLSMMYASVCHIPLNITIPSPFPSFLPA